MEFEIDRRKINEFKKLSNYRKAQSIKHSTMSIWGRWIKNKISPTIKSLECNTSELNSAELAIAILELRQEYRERKNVV